MIMIERKRKKFSYNNILELFKERVLGFSSSNLLQLFRFVHQSLC